MMLSTASDGDKCGLPHSQTDFIRRLDSISFEPSEFYLEQEPSLSMQQKITLYKEQREYVSKWREELLSPPNRMAVDVLINRELVPFDDAVIFIAVLLEEECLKREYARMDAEWRRQSLLDQHARGSDSHELVDRGNDDDLGQVTVSILDKLRTGESISTRCAHVE